MDATRLEAKRASQDYIRKLLDNYIRQGRKARFIADAIGVHESVISRFRSRDINLYVETLKRLENFLMKL